jgi:hypothetical protein
MVNTVTDIALTGVVQPGSIAYNVDEIKKQALAIKQMYETMVYSATTAEQRNKDIKADRAKLNKAAKEAKAKLSEVKSAYMAPFSEFEAGIKEAVTTIGEATEILDKKVKEFEEAARAEKKAQITDYYDKSFTASGIDPNVKNVIFTIIYDPKWENATATQKAYKEGIDDGLTKYESGVKALSGDTYKSYHDEAMKVFLQNLDLAAALAEVEALKKRDEEIIRREKERLEAEAKRKAEAELAEARRRAEEAERKAKEAQEAAEFKVKMETSLADKAEEVKMPVAAPAPMVSTINTASKTKLAIQVVGGAIVGVYTDSNIQFDLAILDEDVSDQREIAEFAKTTMSMTQIY